MDLENEPRQMSWLVFCNSQAGLPTPSSFSLPPRILRRARLSRPHPFRKGRGGCGNILACEGAGAILTEPTSLNRGEGLVTGLQATLEAMRTRAEVEEGWRRGGGEVVVDEGE